MKQISVFRKRLSYVLKTIVILSALIGTFLSAFAGRKAFMGGSTVFMYFTIQSNILIAILSAIGCFLLWQKKTPSKAWYVIKFVGTVAITLTGVVFVVVLAPTLGVHAWNVQNTLTHVVVPVAAVIDFFVTASGADIGKKNVFYVVIPPILYAIYAGIGYGGSFRIYKRDAIYGLRVVDSGAACFFDYHRVLLSCGCRQHRTQDRCRR